VVGDFAEHFTLNARRRQAQWEQVASHLRTQGQGQHRVAAGDFATLEWEPLHALIRHDWVDGYRRARWTYGATWPAGLQQPPFPLARRDYVWLGPTLDAQDADVLLLTGSDHRALRVTLLP
jgi:endonuclease/exonuclease/phosphatase family metal-dependent hydrolase